MKQKNIDRQEEDEGDILLAQINLTDHSGLVTNESYMPIYNLLMILMNAKKINYQDPHYIITEIKTFET